MFILEGGHEATDPYFLKWPSCQKFGGSYLPLKECKNIHANCIFRRKIFENDPSEKSYMITVSGIELVLYLFYSLRLL